MLVQNNWPLICSASQNINVQKSLRRGHFCCGGDNKTVLIAIIYRQITITVLRMYKC